MFQDYIIFLCQTGTNKQLRGVQIGSFLAPLIAYLKNDAYVAFLSGVILLRQWPVKSKDS